MKTTWWTALAVSALTGALTACASSTPTPQTGPKTTSADSSTEKAAPAPETASQLGAPMPEGVTPVKVSDIVAAPDGFSGQTLAVEGVVTKMCKKKGCWFELTDGQGGGGVLVTGKEYNIFLAQGSEGKTMMAYGEFKKEVQDLEEARHLAQDAGEPEPTEAPVKLRIFATAVQFR